MSYQGMKNLFRVILVAGCGWGLFLILGIAEGTFNLTQLIFYTIQSNLLVFLIYGYLVVKSGAYSFRKRRMVSVDLPANIMGAVTLIIVITGLIYNFILVPTIPDTSDYAVNNLSDLLVHTFTPLMVFFDWVVFADTHETKTIKPLTWTVLPIMYWLFTIVRAQLAGPIPGFDSDYPYFFIDADHLGWPQVFLNVALLVLFFVAFGYLMKLLAWLSNRFKSPKLN
ncbi:hypothetical protein NRIC_32930 [Enterococcus florum]|uniref:Integral membrane protein n=1 Tax=Enterococcus florum TaxID=2480627 RepID=A0A4P5PIC3_9ENTE|nr:Pr6Pr family membrane protein [Enterococcus florum]GCF95402.1 hypothetical protein NRIC_32930 [Enterococcus florum]